MRREAPMLTPAVPPAHCRTHVRVSWPGRSSTAGRGAAAGWHHTLGVECPEALAGEGSQRRERRSGETFRGALVRRANSARGATA